MLILLKQTYFVEKIEFTDNTDFNNKHNVSRQKYGITEHI